MKAPRRIRKPILFIEGAPRELKHWLAVRAAINGRPMSAEALAILEDARSRSRLRPVRAA